MPTDRSTQRQTPPRDQDIVDILIVEDHPLVREGMVALLEAEPDLHVCAEASDVDEALDLVEQTRPGVVLVDLFLRNTHGVDLLRCIHERWIGIRTIVVSSYEPEVFAEIAFRAGASGYVWKRDAAGSVVDAVRTVLDGERYDPYTS